MAISRRAFIKIASVAAIATGIAAKPSILAFAQEKVGVVSADPLAYYTQATFTQYINSVFRLHGFATVDVTLLKIQDTLPTNVSRSGGRESFVLHFRGGSVQLPQNTYTVEHPSLGTFKLFLVPSGADDNGAHGYVATINRLAHSVKPSAPHKPTPRKILPTPTPDSKSPETPEVTPEAESPKRTSPVAPKISRPRTRKTDL